LAAFFLFWFANIFVLAADYLVNKGAPVFLVLRFLLFRVPQATPMRFRSRACSARCSASAA